MNYYLSQFRPYQYELQTYENFFYRDNTPISPKTFTMSGPALIRAAPVWLFPCDFLLYRANLIITEKHVEYHKARSIHDMVFRLIHYFRGRLT